MLSRLVRLSVVRVQPDCPRALLGTLSGLLGPPVIYLEVTRAFTVCSRGYQNNQCQNGKRRKAILLTSSCIRPAANGNAESMVCPYMASAQLPPSVALCYPPAPLPTLTTLDHTVRPQHQRSLCQRQVGRPKMHLLCAFIEGTFLQSVSPTSHSNNALVSFLAHK